MNNKQHTQYNDLGIFSAFIHFRFTFISHKSLSTDSARLENSKVKDCMPLTCKLNIHILNLPWNKQALYRLVESVDIRQ